MWAHRGFISPTCAWSTFIYEAPVNLSFLSKAMASRHFINCGGWYITSLPTVRLHYLCAFSSHSFFQPLLLISLCSTALFSISFFLISPSYLTVSTTVITLKRTGDSKGRNNGAAKEREDLKVSHCLRETQRGRGRDVQRESREWRVTEEESRVERKGDGVLGHLYPL